MILLNVHAAKRHVVKKHESIKESLPHKLSYDNLKSRVDREISVVFTEDSGESTLIVTPLPAGELFIEALYSANPGNMFKHRRTLIKLAKMIGAHSVTCDRPPSERHGEAYRRMGFADTREGMAMMVEY